MVVHVVMMMVVDRGRGREGRSNDRGGEGEREDALHLNVSIVVMLELVPARTSASPARTPK